MTGIGACLAGTSLTNSGNMKSNMQLQSASNGIFLMLCGLVTLVAKGLLLNPVSRVLMAVLAIIWGLYLLATKSNSGTSGLMSLAAAAILLVFGGLMRGLASIAGIGLIIVGGVSFVAGLITGKD